jgi:hypothetical protein
VLPLVPLPPVVLLVEEPVSVPMGVVAPGPVEPIELLFAPPEPPGFGLLARSAGVAMLDVRPLPLLPVLDELPMVLLP